LRNLFFYLSYFFSVVILLISKLSDI